MMTDIRKKALKGSAELIGVWTFSLLFSYLVTKKTDEKYPVEYYKVFTGENADEKKAEWKKQQEENRKKRNIRYALAGLVACFFGLAGTIEVGEKYQLKMI